MVFPNLDSRRDRSCSSSFLQTLLGVASIRKILTSPKNVLSFGHSPETLAFWRSLVGPLIGKHHTPFYLFSIVPIQQALADLDVHFGHLPVRHWLSTKTQPLRPLLQWWKGQGRPIEVVSEFEYLAALKEGFAPESILVNGPAKHHWLPSHARPGLFVNFDSTAEAKALALLARKLHWTVGIRLLTAEEFDPENREWPTQFGLTSAEAIPLIRSLRRAGLNVQALHFHLRTNVASPSIYSRAVAEAAEFCRAARIVPRYLDLGGGFPPDHVLTRDGHPVAGDFDLATMAKVYADALREFPATTELWLENGRWLTARSGVLVVKILESKERRGMCNLICDGGRTMNALVSNWEDHELFSIPARKGEKRVTTVNGPTCMAFDQLARRPLPRSLRPGDHLVWMDAGAYHLSWETRFSHGLSTVLWHDSRKTRVGRERESFGDWWALWKSGNVGSD